MSAIRSTIPGAGPSTKGRPILTPLTVTTPTKEVASPDAEMMYAWSIGVTKVGRAYGDPAAPERDEEKACPPEVYIG